jgi:PAS domain S-box-containing protein
MKMLLPVWQVSGDSSVSAAPNAFSGVLVFVIDVSHLIEPITREIRSGKTGYAWVIDDSGMFLYHVDKEFIGKNAFEARKGRTPTISFSRINEIQKERMLKGEEGTSWYTSGWHRGVEGELKKLIAYSPIALDEKNRIWSVAVVAPTSEIEGAIHAILTQQFLLQGLIIFIILFGGIFINFIIISWSNMLEQEVAKKTIELRKSEQRYKSLVENAEDIIFTVDYHGNILTINKYGTKFFDKKEEDIIGHNISENFAWPSAEVLLFNTQKVFETKESRQLTQLAIIGEHQYWFNTKLRRLWDEAGNVYQVLGISRDITALKEKEKEEQRYNIEKLASMGTLAAGVAHEINNPLAIILGFSDLLIEKSNPNTEQYDILKTIEKQAFNAKRVVENLLRFARYTEDKEELVDVNESIEQILSIVKNTLFLNNISLQQQLHDNLPKVKADPLELEQVFLNILNNAIHAMRGGGVLTITTKLINEKTEIRFSDTGHGIKKEYRSKIFDPLFTTKKVGDGTGLGLSVSYGIITKYGGIISFETKTADESNEPGTTFVITLPAVDEKK